MKRYWEGLEERELGQEQLKQLLQAGLEADELSEQRSFGISSVCSCTGCTGVTAPHQLLRCLQPKNIPLVKQGEGRRSFVRCHCLAWLQGQGGGSWDTKAGSPHSCRTRPDLSTPSEHQATGKEWF